ncbi:MAG TPA: S41 family peptidase [Planctomycetota bacterium]|nr:S41 family peptidase [Planctomycetota bacterium]
MDGRGGRHRSDGAWGAGGIVFGVVLGMVLLALVQALLPTREDPDIAHYREVRRFVLDHFVEDVDPDLLVQDALQGMLGNLDEYSRYYDQAGAQRVDRETRGRFTGIGVVFRAPMSAGQILFPVPGGPADEAGLQVGDLLVTIDGEAAIEGGEDSLRQRLRGEPRSKVVLGVRGLDGAEREHHVVRQSLIDPTVRHVRMADAERAIGYLAVSSFSRETGREFDEACKGLQDEGMQGLVIDLRDNPGGVLESAVKLARRFVPEGVIVSTEGRGAPDVLRANPDEALFQDMPLVVLVDGGSASASEVLAGALQDHRVAVILGEPTHGKGVVQTIRRYDERGTIAKVTTSYFYTPAHRNLERNPEEGREWGIVPDLRVSLTADQRARVLGHIQRYGPPRELTAQLRAWEEAESVDLLDEHPEDPQLEAALALLRGEGDGLFSEDTAR